MDTLKKIFFGKLWVIFVNVDDLEKEVIQCGNNDKLVMTFGMLNLLSGRTIGSPSIERYVGTVMRWGYPFPKQARGKLS